MQLNKTAFYQINNWHTEYEVEMNTEGDHLLDVTPFKWERRPSVGLVFLFFGGGGWGGVGNFNSDLCLYISDRSHRCYSDTD